MFDPGGDPLSGTAAWALFPDDGDDADDVVRTADRRLYAPKRGEGEDGAPADALPVAGVLVEPS